MYDYRVLALPTDLVDTVRTRLVSPGYGHPAHVETATGYGPCRHCLEFFEVGDEERILFTYDPFSETDDPALPGPVFVHRRDCARYPEDAGFPRHLLEHPLTLVAYGPGRRPVAEEVIRGGDFDATLGRLLALPDLAYVHVRDTNAGCFDLRIEQGDGPFGGGSDRVRPHRSAVAKITPSPSRLAG